MKQPIACPDHVTHEALWLKIEESELLASDSIEKVEQRVMKLLMTFIGLFVTIASGALAWGIAQRNDQLNFDTDIINEKGSFMVQQAVISEQLSKLSEQVASEASLTRSAIQRHIDDPDAHPAMQRTHR